MKKESGFTLVELLSVIVILSLISVLVGVSVTKMVKESKSDLHSAQIKAIKSAAEAWGADNMNRLPNSGECVYLTLNYLYNTGLLDENIIDPNTKKTLDGDMKIKISSQLSNSNVPILNYEVDVNLESVAACSIILDWIHTDTNENSNEILDVGDVVTASDGGNIQENFYVIADPTNNKVKLLAKYNLKANGSEQDTTGANNTCAFSSTNYWNLNNELSYPDSNGRYPDLNDEITYPLGSATSDVKTRLQAYSTRLDVPARLMTVEEVVDLNGSISGLSTSNCPDFVNLVDSHYLCYWLGSAEDDYYVWIVEDGRLNCYDYDYAFGVRPVVEVPLNYISK